MQKETLQMGNKRKQRGKKSWPRSKSTGEKAMEDQS